jgi:hypothetical protein
MNGCVIRLKLVVSLAALLVAFTLLTPSDTTTAVADTTLSA